jgi:hypothetical protein
MGITRREANRIVKMIIKNYEAGHNDDTLAWLLQREIEELGQKK